MTLLCWRRMIYFDSTPPMSFHVRNSAKTTYTYAEYGARCSTWLTSSVVVGFLSTWLYSSNDTSDWNDNRMSKSMTSSWQWTTLKIHGECKIGSIVLNPLAGKLSEDTRKNGKGTKTGYIWLTKGQSYDQSSLASECNRLFILRFGAPNTPYSGPHDGCTGFQNGWCCNLI